MNTNPDGTAGGPRGWEIEGRVGRGGGGKDQVGKVLVWGGFLNDIWGTCRGWWLGLV